VNDNLKETLDGRLRPQELALVYKSYDIIGDIAIVRIPEQLVSRSDIIADAVMTQHKHVKAVWRQSSPVSGDFRLRELDWIAGQLEAHPGAPSCTACGGIVKTATISFGQPMPEGEMRRAERLTRDCDLFLTVGSSLAVEPAASFPVFAARLGIPLVIINREPTPSDGLANLVIRDDIGDVLAVYADD
jgi:hypothetical protein